MDPPVAAWLLERTAQALRFFWTIFISELKGSGLAGADDEDMSDQNLHPENLPMGHEVCNVLILQI